MKKRQKTKQDFTTGEDIFIIDQKEKGKSYSSIAVALDRSRNSIIGRWFRVLKPNREDTSDE